MKITTIASPTLNTQLEVHAYLALGKFVKVGLMKPHWDYPLVLLSVDPVGNKEIQNTVLPGEFVVCSVGANRPVVKELKDSQVFTDTDKRICLDHTWHEIWVLRPEQLTLLEKECNHEARSENQSEH